MRQRFNENSRAYPLVAASALSFNQFTVLFRGETAAFLHKIFEKYALRRISPTGPIETLFAYQSDERQMQQALKADLVELLVSIALIAEGTLQNRAQFLFQIFDLDDNNLLHEDEVYSMFSAISRAAVKLQLALMPANSMAIQTMVASALDYGSLSPASKCTGMSLSLQDFVAWSESDRAPNRFLIKCGAIPRIRALVQLWQGQVAQLSGKNRHTVVSTSAVELTSKRTSSSSLAATPFIMAFPIHWTEGSATVM